MDQIIRNPKSLNDDALGENFKMFKAHPNLSDDINKNIIDSEVNGGVFVKDLAVGSRLLIQTKNTRYYLDKLGENEYTLVGHQKYCPVPTKVHITGSTFGGSMLKLGFIGRGMYMEFVLDGGDGVITTSQIQEIIEL